MDVRSFIASLNDKMITETGESIFSERNIDTIKAPTLLFIEAKRRFEQDLSSGNAGVGNVKKGIYPISKRGVRFCKR